MDSRHVPRIRSFCASDLKVDRHAYKVRANDGAHPPASQGELCPEIRLARGHGMLAVQVELPGTRGP